jgi:diacylglycerol O-acyltransferase
MRLERLSPEDAAILALESGVVAGHTLKVMILDPPEKGALRDLDDLRAHVAARLDRAPRLRQRLAPTPLRLAPPAWVDDSGFDIARHVRAAATGEVDEHGLAALAAAAMRRRLDRAHPLWLLEAVRLTGGRMALIWTLHHCMADGQTSMRLAEEVL